MGGLVKNIFSNNFFEARNFFLDAAKNLGCVVEHYLHPMRGIQHETLAMDVAIYNPDQSPAWVACFSGVHGVEGYAGSACQIAALQFLTKTKKFPIGFIFVHAVNPYGFSWKTRTNEDNIDLNRHFVDFKKTLPTNSEYEHIHAWLVSKNWDVLSGFEHNQNIRKLIAAVYRGQYQFSDGLFYGGQQPSWSYVTLQKIFYEHLKSAIHITCLDLHTGIGKYASANLIYCASQDIDALQRSRNWFGKQLTAWEDHSAINTAFNGKMMTGISSLFPLIPMTNITLEFGTFSQEKIMTALLASHRVRNHQGSTQANEIRKQMQAVFNPADSIFQKEILDQFDNIFLSLIKYNEEMAMSRSGVFAVFAQKKAPGPTGHLELIPSAGGVLDVGSEVPKDLMVTDCNEEQHNLYDAAQKSAIIYVYPGNGEGMNFGEEGMWGCTPESCYFNKHASNVKIFGMSFQNAAIQRKFSETNQLQFPIITGDSAKQLASMFGISYWKVKDGHERVGTIFPQRTTIVLREGKVASIDCDVTIHFENADIEAERHVAEAIGKASAHTADSLFSAHK